MSTATDNLTFGTVATVAYRVGVVALLAGILLKTPPLPPESAAAREVKVVSMPAVEVASVPGVRVVSMPAVDVSSMPRVTVASLPSVTVGSLPMLGPVAVEVPLDGFPVQPAPGGFRVAPVRVLEAIEVKPTAGANFSVDTRFGGIPVRVVQ